ncbi:3-hydroxyacyl-CoA dehydrogenase [Roseimaritima ulvae]|uniref:Fatty acid oxidation complex subunit alpha n=1 Tax=Roseimaritima ulvae TaxID=980254 RepID=A0A5B9QXH0_9BACT|nr:3-hydroxyacyl-CoA dehydrogenase [Roseimaritima ulvae]QEG42579.1 Fatty acid oxidation complex subunit alpha [Roseimaritima ulvae]
MTSALQPSPDPPNVYLIGCGVVGQAILQAHLAAGCNVSISDLDEARLQAVCEQAIAGIPQARVTSAPPLGEKLPTRHLFAPEQNAIHPPPGRVEPQRGEGKASRRQPSPPGNPEDLAPLAIESIYENREAKRGLLGDLQSWLGPQAVLCSNTSTLPIAGLVEHLAVPEQCCGMHFFMPVEQRELVEIVVPPGASPSTIERATAHARRIGKPALAVADTPGFVVNRMLSPYLNEAFRLLCQGVSAEQLERVAKRFGMPLSPLELVDWIGPRTAFDAGRVYWQAFPGRLDPAPLLPGMIKAKLSGRGGGQGFYQYENGCRSEGLSAAALAVVERYERDPREWNDDEVRCQLFLPMLIEAHLILADGVVATVSEIDTAMRGGLGFRSPPGFFAAFRQWGTAAIAEELRTRKEQRSFSSAESLLEQLDAGRL